MKQITLLVASALLLLTACGQVESSPAEVVPPLAIETQEDVRQLQATPELSAAAQKPDTVSDAAQEQPTEGKAPQTETVPQATQPLEPVKEPTPSEDIPSETVHAKTGYAIAAKAMADQMVTDGRQDAILAASQMLQSWVSVVLVAGVIVAAFIGAAIGKGIVKKHLAA